MPMFLMSLIEIIAVPLFSWVMGAIISAISVGAFLFCWTRNKNLNNSSLVSPVKNFLKFWLQLLSWGFILGVNVYPFIWFAARAVELRQEFGLRFDAVSGMLALAAWVFAGLMAPVLRQWIEKLLHLNKRWAMAEQDLVKRDSGVAGRGAVVLASVACVCIGLMQMFLLLEGIAGLHP